MEQEESDFLCKQLQNSGGSVTDTGCWRACLETSPSYNSESIQSQAKLTDDFHELVLQCLSSSGSIFAHFTFKKTFDCLREGCLHFALKF